MEKLSNWVVRHRLLVGLMWLVVTVVGALIAPSVAGRLRTQSPPRCAGPVMP